MLKKIVSTLLMVAILAVVPVLSGCEEDQMEVHQHSEKQQVHQHTVVE